MVLFEHNTIVAVCYDEDSLYCLLVVGQKLF